MRRIRISFLCFITVLILCFSCSVIAQEQSDAGTAVQPKVRITTWYPSENPYVRVMQEQYKDTESSLEVYYSVLNPEENPDKPQCSASVSPDSSAVITKTELTPWSGYAYGGYVQVYFRCTDYGRADITVNIGDQSIVITVLSLPDGKTISEVCLEAYQKVTVKWTKYNGVDGYLVQRSLPDADEYQTVGTFDGTQTQGTVEAPIGIEYKYRVMPFAIYEGNQIVPNHGFWDAITFAAGIPGTLLKSVSVKNSVVTLQWEEMKGAVRYDIFQSGSDNGSYKKIASVKGVTKWSGKIGKGKPYCYKVKAVYPDGNEGESNSLSQFVREKKKETVTDIKKAKADYTSSGQYGWNWASPDTIGYYVSGKTFYIVCGNSDRKTLTIYGMNNKNEIISKKKLKLPEKYDSFGGFYHGEDNRNYVAVGYSNHKESNTKIVIKIYQYDKNWKRLKTAKIAGGASNSFKGIYDPFEAANVSFAMQGSILYLFTGRVMFGTSDKLHHQSNISFRIDTKSMNVAEANESYTSHSFNQRARFKDGSLYLMDHGDAFPRMIKLTAVNNYVNAKNDDIHSWEAFKFKGEQGNNFTGCKVAGMETGAGNILTVGTALPHFYKIKGKTGMNGNWKENLFVTVTNRTTGKNKVIWLTNYSPARKKNILSEARLVKISDYRFAILVSIDKALHYIAINQNGKVKAHVVYKKVPFTASTQPVLFEGMITWREVKEEKSIPVICRIPVK